MSEDTKRTWRVQWGIHRGTFTSRDVGDAMTFQSEQDARVWVDATRKHFAGMGCVFWFCNLVSPDGSVTSLHENANYDNELPF
jgi:hypothetical protein